MLDFIQGKPIPNDTVASSVNDTSSNRQGCTNNPNKTSKQATLTTMTPKTQSSLSKEPTANTREKENFVGPARSSGSRCSRTVEAVQKSLPTVSKPNSRPTVMRNPYLKNKVAPAPAPVIHPPSTTTTEADDPISHNRTSFTQTSSILDQSTPNVAKASKSHGIVQQQQYQQRTLDGRTLPPPVKKATTNQQKTEMKQKPPRPPIKKILYQPGPVPVCAEAAQEWIYPNDPNYPKRNYQFLITQTALFHNTLVSLPTGLGKTLIAAVVLYNYYRWFPTGKVVFMAPTLPLVTQQVKVRRSMH
jgi:hypothetical protein